VGQVFSQESAVSRTRPRPLCNPFAPVNRESYKKEPPSELSLALQQQVLKKILLN
jgi:hypothetical protein